jgi:predicted HicB family RNase H-like nuclease
MDETKMGRPPKGPVVKGERFELRVDSDEVAAWEQAAKKAGIGRSDWVRSRLNAAAKREAKRP